MKRIVNFSFGLYIAFVFAMAGNAVANDCRLCTAVEIGNVLAVNQLIADNANLKAVDKYGRTALIMAAEKGHVEIVKVLLSAGANLKATTEHGSTALMQAAANGHVEIVKVLLSAGANLKATTKDGINSLMLASGKRIAGIQRQISNSPTDALGLNHTWEKRIERLRAGQVSTMKVLLDAASPKDINALDNSGWTALMYAAEIGSANATRLLINHGADVHLANADGWTALDIAEEVGDRGVARILRKAGAE